MLVVGGRCYTTQIAQGIYAARRGGFYPNTLSEEDTYTLDLFISNRYFLQTGMFMLFVAPAGDADELKKIVTEEGLLKDSSAAAANALRNLGRLEALLGDREYFIGDCMSAADMAVFNVLNENLLQGYPKALGPFPSLQAFVDRISCQPNTRAYLRSNQYRYLVQPWDKQAASSR